MYNITFNSLDQGWVVLLQLWRQVRLRVVLLPRVAVGVGPLRLRTTTMLVREWLMKSKEEHRAYCWLWLLVHAPLQTADLRCLTRVIHRVFVLVLVLPLPRPAARELFETREKCTQKCQAQALHYSCTENVPRLQA